MKQKKIIVNILETERLILDYQTANIIQYINRYNKEQEKKNPKDRKGLTKDMVAAEMYGMNVCSRLTTLRKIDELLIKEMILDKKVKAKTFADLDINRDYPWEDLVLALLGSFHKKVEKAIYGLSKDSDTDELLDEIRQNLINFSNRTVE